MLASYGFHTPSGELTAIAYNKLALQLSTCVDDKLKNMKDKHFDLCKTLLRSGEVKLFDKTVARIDEAVLVATHVNDDPDWAIEQCYFKKSTGSDKLFCTEKFKNLIKSIDKFGDDALRLLDLDGENRLAANQIIADWFGVGVSKDLITHCAKGRLLTEGMVSFAEYFNVEQHKALCVAEINEKFTNKYSDLFDQIDEAVMASNGIDVDSIAKNIL